MVSFVIFADFLTGTTKNVRKRSKKYSQSFKFKLRQNAKNPHDSSSNSPIQRPLGVGLSTIKAAFC